MVLKGINLDNSLNFYRHTVNSHRQWKFKLLRAKLGWSAEGRFWALNNMIAQSDEGILKLSNKNVRVAVMYDLGLNEDEFNNFIYTLKYDCELIIEIDGAVTTEIVRKNLKKLKKSIKPPVRGNSFSF